MRRRLLVALLVGTFACAEAPSDGPSLGSASSQLEAVLDSAWARTLEVSPATRLQIGLPVDRLPDLGYEAAEAGAAFFARQLERLREIDAEDLSSSERIVLETLEWEAEMAVEGHRYYWLQSAITPYSSHFRTYGQLFPRMSIGSEEDLERYVALVEQVPSHIGQVEELVRGQFEREVVVSRQNLEPVTALVRAQASEPQAGPFWIADARVSELDPDVVADARSRIEAVVRDSINPALDALGDFLAGPYAAQAPAGVGISQYPNGRDYYLYLTRLHTTMDVTPEEVQQAGHELLAEFQARMAEIRDRIGWEGTAEAFHEHLRTDPQYFPESPDEVRERLQVASDAMLEEVDRYFLTTPEAPWAPRRLAPELEPGMTYGFYSPPTAADPAGYYYFNGSSLDERSWLGLTAISLHELIPGHHFQIAAQLENESLPEVRRSSYYTAYSEGWGSYASFIGLEAGVYDDPLSEYGLYILESFLATRLVVDPGMNYFGMTREEALDFMRANTLESETQIGTESLRYSTDLPGQALGYQMGKRRLIELRERAEAELGDRFDIRAFHEAVLENGSIPLVVLEGHIDRWIEASGS